MLRQWLVRLHRWLGLTTAVFLFIAGLTGSLIAWDHEIDGWLNPQIFKAQTAGTPLSAQTLVARAEQAEPHGFASYHPLAVEPGHTFIVWMQPRRDASGKLYDLGFNQMALDPVTGAVQAKREWGKVALDREHIMPFLYQFHYTLQLPQEGGVALGIWLMGCVAIAWVIDSLIALWISFPKVNQWRRSLSFRWAEGGHRLVFDLHRSGGVWLFAILLIMAVTSVSMNLNAQVMRPLVSLFSDLSPSPLETREVAAGGPREPKIARWDAVSRAQAEAVREGWSDPAGAVFLNKAVDVWSVGFFRPGNDHGDGGLGNPWVYIDTQTGKTIGMDVPGEGSAGDVFLKAMFPLHSGRILGLPGRILVSTMGLMVAGFSATGVWIWARKRRARKMHSSRNVAASKALA